MAEQTGSIPQADNTEKLKVHKRPKDDVADQKADGVVEWKSKQEVSDWFNGVVIPAFKEWLEGEPTAEAAEKATTAVGSSSSFKMHILDQVMDADGWKQFSVGVPAFYKSIQRHYDVDLWHARYALVSFTYFDTFIDDTTLVIKGKCMAIRDEKGEVVQWVYFSKDGSLEASFQKLGELAAAAAQNSKAEEK